MTPSAKMNLVLLILFLSIGINIYELMLVKKCTSECYEMKDSCNMACCDSSKTNGKISAWTFCENQGRYNEESTKPEDQKGGEELTETDAYKLIDDYKSIHKNETTGFLLSKYIIDNIFDNPNPKKNMVRCDLVERNGQLSLIVRGVYTTYTLPKFNGKQSRFFIAQSWCPSDCPNAIDTKE
jgi:hypothetical protein